MKKDVIVYECIEELADEILDNIDNLEDYDSINVVADYETIEKLIVDLICFSGNFTLPSLHIESPDMDGYEDAWCLSVTKDYEMYCERMLREEKDKYIGFEGYLYTRKEYIDKILKDVPWIEDYTLFKFDGEEDEDNEPQVCFDWDKDRQGFVFCICVGGTQQKFRYRGTTKLDEETALNIVNAYLG